MKISPDRFNRGRIGNLIRGAIREFDLDLSNLTVLTEAATGYYILTPMIAAMAGAQRVYALTKDSRYGQAADVAGATMELAREFRVDDRLKILLSRDAPEIGTADVVTNLGHVRPLDKSFLRRLKTTVAIPLMWERWEFRPEDLDLPECRALGIPVLATNETCASLRIFRYVGHLALKLLFDADVEIFKSRVLLFGSHIFGAEAYRSLTSAEAEVVYIDMERDGPIDARKILSIVAECDAIVVSDHVSRKKIIGAGGIATASDIAAVNPSIVVAHIAGNVDENDLRSHGIRFVPGSVAKSGYMSVSTDYLGPRPLIDLHAAGLKVGELLSRARLNGCPRAEAERRSLESAVAQSMDNDQDNHSPLPICSKDA